LYIVWAGDLGDQEHEVSSSVARPTHRCGSALNQMSSHV